MDLEAEGVRVAAVALAVALVAVVRPVAESEEPEKIDFSFLSTQILMSIVWERIETQKRLLRHLKAMMMSFVRVTVDFTAWPRTSSAI